mmetsp:Transcript_23374/g.32750  ORF Transcript_23374/g.32750 Transcript_23374/m.32750 type:complete len:295 (+) Transcript_23374:130-1014(+)
MPSVVYRQSFVSVNLFVFLLIISHTSRSALAFSRVLTSTAPSRTFSVIPKRQDPSFPLSENSIPRETTKYIQLHATSNMEDSIDDATDASGSLPPALALVGSTTSAVVAGTFFFALAYRRDALMVAFFIGAISNGILSKILKKVINQARPENIASDIKLKPSDGGMPSSHAMSLGFIGTFTGMLLEWAQIPIFLYSMLSLYYRVETKLHTKEQVAVGLVVGSTNGYIWKTLCDGTNSYLSGVNVMDWVTNAFLNENGVLPFAALAVPALVGALVVGSAERRIIRFLKNKKKKQI